MRETAARSHAADAELIAFAQERALPLITSEGYTPTGMTNRGMRKTGAASGVRVFTAAEYYAGKVDERAEGIAFINRFRQHCPAYLREQKNRRAAREILQLMDGYYRHILFGETAGMANVSVRVDR